MMSRVPVRRFAVDAKRHRAPHRVTPFVLVATLALAACGGGGGDDEPSGGTAGLAPAGDLVPGTSSGRAASDVETEELRRNAATITRSSIGNLSFFGDDTEDDGGTGPGATGGTDGESGGDPSSTGDTELVAMVDDGSDAFFERTLEDPNATVTREGDVITIDPDDAALCEDDPGVAYDDALGVMNDATGEPSICMQLVADLTIRIEARTEDSGVIVYLFQGEPVLSIGYSPEGIIQELVLDGVERVLARIAALDAAVDPGSVPTMRGTLRWSALVFDDTPGRESGELEISVTEAVEVAERDGEGLLSLAPSRVLRASYDEAREEIGLSVAWGALRLVTVDEDELGNPARTSLDLGGLTLDVDTGEGANALSLRNVGIGGVPLRIRVDDSDALTLALETFGVTVDGESGTVTFDTAAGIELALDNLGGAFEEFARDYTARFTASAPAGTAFVERAEGVLEVVGGGPLVSSFVASDGSGSVQNELSAGVGSCFGAREPAADGNVDDTQRLSIGLDLSARPCP